jgi:hypothetical protein
MSLSPSLTPQGTADASPALDRDPEPQTVKGGADTIGRRRTQEEKRADRRPRRIFQLTAGAAVAIVSPLGAEDLPAEGSARGQDDTA